MTINEPLRKYWEQQGIANPQRATSADIATFEAQHGLTLPPVIADYFLIVNWQLLNEGAAALSAP